MSRVFIFNLMFMFLFEKVLSFSHNDFHDELTKQSPLYGLVSLALNGSQDTVCSKEMASVAEGIMDGNRWAIKMLDASGTPGSGFRWGNTFWLGSKQQCEELGFIRSYPLSPIEESITIETQEDVPAFPVSYYGAYFDQNSNILTKVLIKEESIVTLGLCLPSSCNESEIQELLQKYFDNNMKSIQQLYNMTLKMVGVKKIEDDQTWLKEKSTIALGIITCILIILSVLGTIYDIQVFHPLIKTQEQINKPADIDLYQRLILCFSASRNNKFIFNTDIGKDSIKCINGLRCLAMIHIMLGHNVYFLLPFCENRRVILETFHWFSSAMIFNIQLSSDTYSCISGYLLSYMFFKEKHSVDGMANQLKLLFKYIVRRLERITPSYYYSILLVYVISKWRANSMIFKSYELIDADVVCSKYWWRNILFIHTWYRKEEFCVIWSWSISNDVQNYIIISFLLILSLRHRKAAAFIFAFICFSSIGYIAYMTYTHQYFMSVMALFKLRDIFYFPSWMRINAYNVGAIAGYMAFKLNKKLRLKRSVLTLIWLVYTCLTSILLFGYGDFSSIYLRMIYVSTHRLFWSVTIAWILIACETGNGGIVNKILCAKIWIPLANINFWAYLLNPFVVFVISSFSDKAFNVVVSNILVLPIGFLYNVYVLSYILTLILELPIANVIKTLNNHYRFNHRNESEKSIDIDVTECKDK